MPWPDRFCKDCPTNTELPATVRTVSRNSTVVAARDLVSCNLADEAVILNLKDGIYYGLNSVGGRIWSLIQESRTVDQIQDVILEEYEIDPDSCERDLLMLVGDLAARELVRIDDETLP
jgi:hypothetical protein